MSGSDTADAAAQAAPQASTAATAEQSSGSQPAAASGGGQVRNQLRGMNYEQGAALVSPSRASTGIGGQAQPVGQSGSAGGGASAGAEQGQSKGIGGAIRDRLTLEGRREEVTEQASEIPSQDVIYEQLAHRFAYDDEPDAAALAVFGYGCVDRIIDPQTDLQAFVFAPISERVAEMTEKQGRAPRTVVAFRGTSSAADVEDDANTEGIGMFQFSANEPGIGALMGRWAPVDVVGHSLGGALAQIAAARFPGATNRVVTFQSPGINLSDVQNLQRHNRGAAADQRVGATHYRTDADVVPLGGEQHIDGRVHQVSYTGVPTPASHMSYPLANVENLREGEYAGQLRDGDDDVITNTAVDEVSSRNHRGRGRQATDAARVAAGEVRDHATNTTSLPSPYSPVPTPTVAVDPAVSNFQGDDYARAWESAKAQARAGVPLQAIVTQLGAAPNVDQRMRTRLITNITQMYASLAPARKQN